MTMYARRTLTASRWAGNLQLRAEIPRGAAVEPTQGADALGLMFVRYLGEEWTVFEVDLTDTPPAPSPQAADEIPF